MQAVDLALYLIADHIKVQIVHDGLYTTVDKERSMWVRNYLLPYIQSEGVRIWSSSTAKSVSDEGLTIVGPYKTDILLECDTVIECYDMVPNLALYDSIKGSYEAYAVGDCFAPWSIADAIIRGNCAGRKIGS